MGFVIEIDIDIGHQLNDNTEMEQVFPQDEETLKVLVSLRTYGVRSGTEKYNSTFLFP